MKSDSKFASLPIFIKYHLLIFSYKLNGGFKNVNFVRTIKLTFEFIKHKGIFIFKVKSCYFIEKKLDLYVTDL